MKQQTDSRKRITKERKEMLELVNKRLERERQQRDRELAGLAPYVSGMGNPNREIIPEVDV